MKFLLCIACILLGATIKTHAQSYLYKKNSFGQVEIFASSYGHPTGQPVAKIKRNVWGYLEIESLQSNSAFTSRNNPNFKTPYYNSNRTELASVINSINTTNLFIQNNFIINNSSTGTNKNDKSFIDAINSGNEEASNRLQDINNLYSQFVNKPKVVANGWHEVVTFSSITAKNNTTVKTVFSGYANVQNNKITQIIEYLTMGDNVVYFYDDVISNSINDCQAIYKLNNSSLKFTNVYFINALFNPTLTTNPPKLGRHLFYSTVIGMTIVVYKKDPKVYGDGMENFINIYSENENFTNVPGTYHYIATDKNNRRWEGTFTLIENSFTSVRFTLK